MSSDIRMKNMWIDFSRNASPSPAASSRRPSSPRVRVRASREAQLVEQRPPVGARDAIHATRPPPAP